MVTKDEISKVMAALVEKRWAKTTQEERSVLMRKTVMARWTKKKGAKKAGKHAKKT